MKIIWLKEAAEDLKLIARYISTQNPKAAFRVITRIKAAVNTLQSLPQASRTGRVCGTFELVITGSPYIVPYYIKDEEIRILAVIHGAQKWPDEFTGIQ